MMTSATFDQLYSLLNPGQKQAVDAIEGPVMVLAGPGTGKTQALAMRVANILLKTHMDPWNILCLTFTESGVAAMRSRLIDIIGEAAYAVRIHTFHSFCNDIIQEFPEKFTGYLASIDAPNLSLTAADALSDTERVEFFRSILDGLPHHHVLKPFGQPYLYLFDILDDIKKLKQEGISVDRYEDVIERIASFKQNVDTILAKFFALTPKERSEAQCEQLRDALQKEARANSVDHSIWRSADRIFIHHFEDASASPDIKEQSKRRTKLKSDLQRWYRGVVGPLPKQQGLRVIYDRYQKMLKEKGRYDYEDMLLAVIRQLAEDDDLLASFQEQFQYILVDEYQDTNSAQNEALRLLGSFSDAPNICVVGDDKQSIYRFQGASLENLLFFYEMYKKDVAVVSLTDNYRSHEMILNAAGELISHNEESVSRYVPGVASRLQSKADVPSCPLESFTLPTEEAEDFFVARKIQQLLDEGVDPGEIAVLYRYHRDAEGLLDVMLRLGVPVRREGKENILNDFRITQLLTLLHYIAHPDQDSLLANIIHFDFWGFRPLDVVRVIHAAGTRRQLLFGVIGSKELLVAAGVQEPGAWLSFAEKMASWTAARANMVLPEFFDRVLQESGFLQVVTAGEGDIVVLNKLTTLFQELKHLSRLRPGFSLHDFIHHVGLLKEYLLPLTAQELHTKKKAVRLMTAHKSKGLEFDYVFIMRLKDKHWGNSRSRTLLPLPQGLLRYDPVAAQENNEDERRLFYVALTRARRQLYLTHAVRDVRGRERVPSLFLHELPAEYVEAHTPLERDEESVQLLQTLALAPVQPDGDVTDWVRGALERYVMSVTHLNDYLECPRRFYWRDLVRVPEVASAKMAFGNAVHKALRDFFSRFELEKNLPSLAFLLERFTLHLEQERLTDGELRDGAAKGKMALTKYYQHQKDLFRPSLFQEYSFASHGVRSDGIPITGKLDNIEWVDQLKNTVRVIDYKTGNPDTARRALQKNGKYYRQLIFYQMLCDLSPRFPYTMVEGRVDFIEPGHTSGECLIKEFRISQSDVNDLQSKMKDVWQDIQALTFLDPDAGCKKPDCRYCQLGKN